ncbi:MAG: TetR/AcrR family transcriptional regulator [Alphaproteobacteria bacterium]
MPRRGPNTGSRSREVLRARRPARRTYHHGDLRAALLAAAEALIAERGLDGFSLREAARRAGVSPAAPSHHFGDTAGLLTELAIDGFERLSATLAAATEAGGADPIARYRAQGAGYVAFAMANPGRFRLMFRVGLVDDADPRLDQARRVAFGHLLDVVRPAVGRSPDAPLDPPLLATAFGAWSMVHGYSHLALDGLIDRFGPPGPPGAFAAGMAEAVLTGVPLLPAAASAAASRPRPGRKRR